MPDGAAHITVNNRPLTWWYEHDTGTETLSTLTDKARRYSRLYSHEGYRSRHMALFEITKPGREANFHHALAGTGLALPVATATSQDDLDPLSAVWWPLGHPACSRRRLTELPVVELPSTPARTRRCPWNPK
ncbi:replication-relaxation family protein [Glycomyces salinus]|uniref:replication-relaxation family protein n=1 Tax=Glycomyces salinus TaxID=980294 RepID=UPI0035569D38